MTPKYNPLFIVGLQKSGTTLLNRLLLKLPDVFQSPFELEGRYFWGDHPPFTPVGKPCGALYQKKLGLSGHALNSKDFSVSDQQNLLSKLNDKTIQAPILINKNPYNSVRISWLKKMFPNCRIIAIVRHPASNVFSLLKKHIPHEHRGLGPENGWWGVKPHDWQKINQSNTLTKVSRQYQSVNNCLLSHISKVDLLISYNQLCDNPSNVITMAAKLFDIDVKPNIEPITCRDFEYKFGSRLLSMNREYSTNSESLEINEKENPVELKKLSYFERCLIWSNTHKTWRDCKLQLSKLTE